MNTITIETLPGYPAVLVKWQHEINPEDLRPAFREVVTMLHNSPVPLYIVMDLLQNPRFPVVTTMSEALIGPFRHPRLAAWLVIGGNTEARWIGSMLTKITRRTNIVWFDSTDEVIAYLDKQPQP